MRRILEGKAPKTRTMIAREQAELQAARARDAELQEIRKAAHAREAGVDPSTYIKLERDKTEIGNQLRAWADGQGGDLKSRLNRFVDQGNKDKRIEGLGTDGLRCAVTGLHQVMRSGASDDLKARAHALNTAVLFRTAAGKNITVDQFASQNQLEEIDALRLSPAVKKAIVARLTDALDDIHALYQACNNRATVAPPAKFNFNPAAVIIANGEAAPPSPGITTGAELRRSNHIRRRPLPEGAQERILLARLEETHNMRDKAEILAELRGLAKNNPALNRRIDVMASEMKRILRRELKDTSHPQLRAMIEGDLAAVIPVAQRPVSGERLRETRALLSELRHAPDAETEKAVLEKLQPYRETDADLEIYLQKKDYKPDFWST